MTREFYLKILHWAKKTEKRSYLLCFFNRFIPYLLGGLYGILMIYLYCFQHEHYLEFVLRPFFCFLSVTFLRHVLNAQRPYDRFDFIPLSGYKPGKGHSFPSRHATSAMIIALMIFKYFPRVGFLSILLAFITGSLRIIGGNHFIKDVLSGFLFAIIFAYV